MSFLNRCCGVFCHEQGFSTAASRPCRLAQLSKRLLARPTTTFNSRGDFSTTFYSASRAIKVAERQKEQATRNSGRHRNQKTQKRWERDEPDLRHSAWQRLLLPLLTPTPRVCRQLLLESMPVGFLGCARRPNQRKLTVLSAL